MSSSLKYLFLYFICILGILLALLGMYFGSYLPMEKAQRYIAALRFAQTGSINSFESFKNNFDKALTFYSPIGDEEVAKFLSSDIAGLIADPKQSEVVRRALLQYIEPYMEKSNVRHLLTLAGMYRALWIQEKHEDDYKKAEEYYRAALAIGPKLPPILYAMLDMYTTKGDVVKADELRSTILQYWDDPRVKSNK